LVESGEGAEKWRRNKLADLRNNEEEEKHKLIKDEDMLDPSEESMSDVDSGEKEDMGDQETRWTKRFDNDLSPKRVRIGILGEFMGVL
jgi:hypothetical protein